MVAHMHACARTPARMVHGWMDGYLCLSLSLPPSLSACLSVRMQEQGQIATAAREPRSVCSDGEALNWT